MGHLAGRRSPTARPAKPVIVVRVHDHYRAVGVPYDLADESVSEQTHDRRQAARPEEDDRGACFLRLGGDRPVHMNPLGGAHDARGGDAAPPQSRDRGGRQG